MNIAQQHNKPTSLERKGYALLDAMGIRYERQYVVNGKFCVDAWIPEARLVVQFDGDYWHGNPARYTTLDHRQRKRVALDLSQDAYLTACGIKVIRIWDSEFNQARDRIAATLLGYAPYNTKG